MFHWILTPRNQTPHKDPQAKVPEDMAFERRRARELRRIRDARAFAQRTNL